MEEDDSHSDCDSSSERISGSEGLSCPRPKQRRSQLSAAKKEAVRKLQEAKKDESQKRSGSKTATEKGLKTGQTPS